MLLSPEVKSVCLWGSVGSEVGERPVEKDKDH